MQGSFQQRNPSSVAMTTPPVAGACMTATPFPGQQAQAAREVNTASLCRIGQETVQDIVFRTMEIFQLLRNMQLPNGVTYHPNTHQDRLAKLQEHLRQLSVLFRKLRLVYDKCNENCAGLDPMPVEQLIPYVEEDSKHEEHSSQQSRYASDERREVLEVNKKLKQKNQQLKQIMDQLRNLIWEINSMLAVRN
ncbi:mediator of RNA polymerase II transcription subunit 30 [Brienomyrus brachyistius]|uniref:mediator of RNA polymerase II transcription subunit 30 n=1 Tax=Brienomyrus brachyistius TaxID=42636 RepID=UPI0020B2A6AF|nr:mediator of RNA polymerase II transcription subunit 30 [Brienomyrus brachyistius]XP_048849599.1 mediator of RNA polymerase II transcription subunit 30 [Brienomyrus brachyistius]